MRGRGRTGATYSFALICHRSSDYRAFWAVSVQPAAHKPHLERPYRSQRGHVENSELGNAIKDMEYKHNFIVESCSQSDFRHWLASNFKAVELASSR